MTAKCGSEIAQYDKQSDGDPAGVWVERIILDFREGENCEVPPC